MNHYSPEDRPEASEQPIRARVPDHVSGGAFSTGVIVMTAQTEFILDFVQNLGRPHQIVARVVMTHNVLPQLVDALQRNIELYRSRWGELPRPPVGEIRQLTQDGSRSEPSAVPQESIPQELPRNASGAPAATGHATTGASGGGSAQTGESASASGGATPDSESDPPPRPPTPASTARQATAQEVYDDLKIRDELLSGCYANAVMIGHGPHEFSFDFITNFYPNSAVSARVFLAAGQIPRLYDSLKGTWDQLRRRMQPPPGGGFEPPTDFT
ncbi:MAG: DUF3467 domain-containing protein [Planctomycetales bacterium]|nr:DUF3467 domain-containing protein [Planctomycetales bacterium]